MKSHINCRDCLWKSEPTGRHVSDLWRSWLSWSASSNLSETSGIITTNYRITGPTPRFETKTSRIYIYKEREREMYYVPTSDRKPRMLVLYITKRTCKEIVTTDYPEMSHWIKQPAKCVNETAWLRDPSSLNISAMNTSNSWKPVFIISPPLWDFSMYNFRRLLNPFQVRN
jgi:hypothetical protein